MMTRFTIFAVVAATFSLGRTEAFAKDAYEPNDSRKQAYEVKSLQNADWKEVTGVTFHSGADEDWFKIVTTVKGTMEVEVESSKEVHASIFGKDEAQSLTSAIEVGKVELSVANLEPGAYFVYARNVSGGSATLKLRVRISDPTTYRGWLVDEFESPNLSSNADPNGDGVSLGIEWVFRRPANANATYGNPVYPIADALGMVYVVTFPFIEGTRQPVRLEMSTDLKKWTLVPVKNISSGATTNPVPAGQTGRVDLFFHWDDTPDAIFVRVSTEKVK